MIDQPTAARSLSPDDAQRILDHAYRVLVDERIRELWRWRHWYRTHRWCDWSELRKEHMAELRALVRLARQARRGVRPIVERLDPITQAKAAEDWAPGELVEAWGR